jgi:hypothetical protein
MARCQGTTRAGDRCKREAQEGSRYCYTHEPKENEQKAAASEAEATADESLEMEEILPLVLGLLAAGLLVWGMRWIGRWLPKV